MLEETAIQRLVKAMDDTGWIKTLVSSQGRSGYLFQDGGHVSFHCQAAKVPELCAVVNRIERNSEEPVSLQLYIIHNLENSHCQYFAPQGSLSVCLEFGKARSYDRLFRVAAREFKKIFMRTEPEDSYGVKP